MTMADAKWLLSDDGIKLRSISVVKMNKLGRAVQTESDLDSWIVRGSWQRLGLPKLVQPYAPSILFPVRHPAIGPGISQKYPS